MKMIKILQCSHPNYWYANLIGEVVPLLREYDTEFMSREPDGYANIVLKQDAILVEVGNE